MHSVTFCGHFDKNNEERGSCSSWSEENSTKSLEVRMHLRSSSTLLYGKTER
jgi:hypothetical protein